MADTIKKSEIQDYLQNEQDLTVGSDVYEAADEALKEVLYKAAERARADGRWTVKARDM